MASRTESVAFSGYTVLRTAQDGSITDAKHGLFHRDTRVLSAYRLTIADAPPELVTHAQPESDRWEAVFQLPRPGGNEDGPQLPQDALELRLERRVGPGLAERITVRNHSALPCTTRLRIEFDADFADVAEIARDRQQRGTIERHADANSRSLRLQYRAEQNGRTAERGLHMEVADANARAEVDPGGVTFPLDLEPNGSWETNITFAVLEGDAWRSPESIQDDRRATQRRRWRGDRPHLEGAGRLSDAFDRAADDLFDLRNWELETQLIGATRGDRWVLNAGVPTFTGLFGRDVITSGWQSMLLGPRAARGALDAVAAVPATADDPWRDAEPGKLIHELRLGPMAELGLWPRDAYYGSQTTPSMFVLALSELWHWTGDIAWLRRHRDTALRAMGWAASYGDPDGDGFLEYQQRSPKGLRNQGWKDSNEAIRHADGSIADGPIATVEEQAFYYMALERMAEILVALDDESAAEAFLERADALRPKWHEAFWMADEGFYALALDGDNRPARSITSNPGHALGTGIVPPEHAAAVADRLLAPDLFSGWGIRSLSNAHPSYNPFAYHLGAVWPVEQATFALGFKRYGLDDHLETLTTAVVEAALASPDSRLPEALSGHERSWLAAPIPYPKANSPQAWSASALIQMVQIMLGIYPFAPMRVLAVVRPRLPAWLPELRLTRLRVGPSMVDLHFKRRDDGTAAWSVHNQRGRLLVIGAGPPDDPDGRSWLEQVEYSALQRMPGRLVRAARIALGLR
jgi:glycogen debranching enzyme